MDRTLTDRERIMVVAALASFAIRLQDILPAGTDTQRTARDAAVTEANGLATDISLAQHLTLVMR
jgi:hypothetical protein